MSLLEINALEVVYGKIRATHGISFAVAENEITALVGANGAGKSSTMKAIMGLVKYPKGGITFAGADLAGLQTHQVVRAGIGYSPEGRRVFPALNVADNLMAGAHTLARAAVGERMEQIFEYFPRLRERARQAAGSMSGGEQQMLAIGRALMSKPSLLLLDEPSLGLSPVMVERIGDLVRAIQAKEKLAVIIAEQNSTWALRLASRGIVVEVGEVKMIADAESLRKDEYIRRAYLGA